LYETVSELSVEVKTTASANVTQTISIEDVSEFAIWNNSTKKMILVGVNEPNAINEKIIALPENRLWC
jgi:2-succinyl-5-enolpyruvyl-6-hydroxy-3-cyclohexene-1-carboxylate synthase